MMDLLLTTDARVSLDLVRDALRPLERRGLGWDVHVPDAQSVALARELWSLEATVEVDLWPGVRAEYEARCVEAWRAVARAVPRGARVMLTFEEEVFAELRADGTEEVGPGLG